MHGSYRGFGSILKVEDQPDGTVKVYGVASTGARDLAGEIVAPEAMKAALPDYSKFPALREMHQPSAAGKVLDAYVDDDGATQIEAHVVDPVAVMKVKTGVYAGFSIGGRVTKRDPEDRTIIKQMRLTEISLVDAPCNPECTLNMWKADAMSANPTNEETIAKAKEMAESAGRKSYKDFLFKAREELIKAAAEAEDEDETDEVPGDVAASDDAGNTDPGDQSDPGDEDPADKAAGADPVSALGSAIADALEKAKAAKGETSPAPAMPLEDFAKGFEQVAEALDGKPLFKGLRGLRDLAAAIYQVVAVQAAMAREAAEEGDNSQVPTQVADAIRTLGEALVASAQEEVAELLSDIEAAGFEEEVTDWSIYECAAPVVDLVKADADLMAKAGARNSAKDIERIQTLHNTAVDLGAKCHGENVADGTESKDESAKMDALTAENERLTKALSDAPAQVEEIAKAFNETIDGLKSTVTDLTKRLEQVESQPAAPKTATLLTPITKGQDVAPDRTATDSGMSADEFRKLFDQLPEDEKGKLLVKVALANPLQVSGARAAR